MDKNYSNLSLKLSLPYDELKNVKVYSKDFLTKKIEFNTFFGKFHSSWFN